MKGIAILVNGEVGGHWAALMLDCGVCTVASLVADTLRPLVELIQVVGACCLNNTTFSGKTIVNAAYGLEIKAIRSPGIPGKKPGLSQLHTEVFSFPQCRRM